MENTYTIPAGNLPQFEERLAKLNKRAGKLGVPQITYSTAHAYNQYEYARFVSKDAFQTVLDTDNTKWLKKDEPPGDDNEHPDDTRYAPTGRVREWLTLTVTGEAPKYAGWEFVATLEPIQADGVWVNLMQCVPGKSVPDSCRTCGSKCDHCHTARKRNQTFVVRYEDGTHKIVGRQCLRDFLGHTDPHKLAAWAELLCELGSLADAAGDEFWGGGGYTPDSWDLEFYLGWVASVVAHDGWVSRTAARDDLAGRKTATADRVLYLVGRPPVYDAAARREWEAARAEREPIEAHKAEAEAALEWARSLPEADLTESNYLANINAVARAGYTTHKLAGLAASIIAAYAKAQDRLKYAERQAARPPSNWVGKIGERLTLAGVVVEKAIPVEGEYGVTNIHRMHDADGNDLVWFASGGGGLDYEEDKPMTIVGTVKSHSEYNGRKQTTLNRVKEAAPPKPRGKSKKQQLAEAALERAEEEKAKSEAWDASTVEV